MKLRAWQSECINQAILQYIGGQSHFLCLATPGAGKTLMASRLAKRLKDEDLIDLVICITPSLIVSEDFRTELEGQLDQKMDGRLGSIGKTLTYQAMLSENYIWDLFEQYKVFVIFDEIHHCAGSDLDNSNAWGEKIISNIQGKAAYTLALTGTPWRSDSIPISLGSYTEDGFIHCDYSYGLTQAISDNVCRTPKITLFDNDNIILNESGCTSKFDSFNNLLCNSNCSYQSLIESEALIRYMLEKANKRLNLLREVEPNSGGLIVAASTQHARVIYSILKRYLNDDASIVTYLEPDSVSLIKKYKYGNSKWIISVGMISEGTNIPRLKICCYLTRVKTELYFRQVLGRVLRVSRSNHEYGYFYMPAEPTLSEFAHRVSKDIPDGSNIDVEKIPRNRDHKPLSTSKKSLVHFDEDKVLELNSLKCLPVESKKSNSSLLSKGYENSLGLFGKFENKVISLGGLI
jgi:superfamily II DNA or RNA helicase